MWLDVHLVYKYCGCEDHRLKTVSKLMTPYDRRNIILLCKDDPLSPVEQIFRALKITQQIHPKVAEKLL